MPANASIVPLQYHCYLVYLLLLLVYGTPKKLNIFVHSTLKWNCCADAFYAFIFILPAPQAPPLPLLVEALFWFKTPFSRANVGVLEFFYAPSIMCITLTLRFFVLFRIYRIWKRWRKSIVLSGCLQQRVYTSLHASWPYLLASIHIINFISL